MSDTYVHFTDGKNVVLIKAYDLGDTTYALAMAGAPVGGIIVNAGENHIGSVGGQHITAIDSFTRPNDTVAYSIGDALTNSTSAPVALHFANILRVNAGTGYAVKAILACSNAAIATQLRLHLYDTAPTMPNDNTQWNPVYDDIITTPIYRGYLDFPAFSQLGSPANSGAGAQVESTTMLSIGSAVASKDLYGVLQVITAFTPQAQLKFGVRLTVDVN